MKTHNIVKTFLIILFLVLSSCGGGTDNTGQSPVPASDTISSDTSISCLGLADSCSEDDTASDVGNSDETTLAEELQPAADISETEAEETISDALNYDTAVYYIIAQDGTYLGDINVNPYDLYSICNRYGNYGSPYGLKSIFNEYGSYGGAYGIYSAFNDYSINPPIIFRDDEPWIYLSTNAYVYPRIDAYALLGFLRGFGCDVER